MRATIIGAGRIALGLAAERFHQSGYEVTVLGRGPVSAALQRSRTVEVELTDGWETERFLVPVRTVDLADRSAAVKAVSTADVVGTAVGARMLPAVLDLIAEGLKRAVRPVNVIAFENHENAARIVRKGLRTRLGPGVDRHGFTGAVIARAVAHRVFAADGRVRVVGDLPREVVVDGAALVDPAPLVQDFIPVDDFRAYYRRKLYRFSAGHATTAYLGKLKGYRYLHAAAMDPEIAEAVLGAMEEGRRGLAARYGEEVSGTPEDLEAILWRFRNAALGDTVDRVGRDALRKLGRGERLVGAARLAVKGQVPPIHLTRAAAAALVSDPSLLVSRERMIAKVSQVTGVGHRHVVTRMVAHAWGEFVQEEPTSAPFLQLPEMSISI